MGYCRGVYYKIRRNKGKTEWVLNEFGLNASMSDPYERSILKYFFYLNRMNEDQTAKQMYEEK